MKITIAYDSYKLTYKNSSHFVVLILSFHRLPFTISFFPLNCFLTVILFASYEALLNLFEYCIAVFIMQLSRLFLRLA